MTLRGLFRRKSPRGAAPGVQDAQRALDRAREQHAEQAAKREQEHGRLIRPMERFAEENHLASLLLDAATGNGGDVP